MMHVPAPMVFQYLPGDEVRPSHFEVAFIVTFYDTGNPYLHAIMYSSSSPHYLLMPYNIMGLKRGMP